MIRSDRRYVIFFFEGWIGVQPTILNLARALGTAGHPVTIYAVPTTYPAPGDLGPNVELKYIGDDWIDSAVLALMAAPGVGRVVGRLHRDLGPAAFSLRGGVAELRRRGASKTTFIGVDSRGAMAAAFSALVTRGRYVFLSLELRLTQQQLRGAQGLLLRNVYRRAACVIVQGQDRLDVLRRQFQHEHPRVFFVPNGPPPSTLDEHDASQNILRERLGIEPGQRIALQAGMINDTACSEELSKAFAPHPEWALVFHERHPRSPDEPYLTHLRSVNARNLYLSLQPVPYDQVERIFASADVGLAFYKPASATDDNFSQISSSGKLPHYLQQGKPVLMSDLPYMVELAQEFNCGFVIKDPADPREVGSALAKIAADYDTYRRNALACYEARFNFRTAVQRLQSFLNDL